MANPDEILASRLRHSAVRLEMRIDAAEERDSESVCISLGFARELARTCRHAEQMLAPYEPEPAKPVPGDDPIF